MEFCEGGSLEAVGKRIKERNAIVGEKIAGRLAEGVCPLAHFSSVLYN
jgi:mitogen-activated protein kinase kinase